MELYLLTFDNCVTGLGSRVLMCFPETVAAYDIMEDGNVTQTTLMKRVTPNEAFQTMVANSRNRSNASNNFVADGKGDGKCDYPNLAQLKAEVNKMPSIKKMQEYLAASKQIATNPTQMDADQYLKQHLATHTIFAYPVMKWLTISNKAYLRLLQPSEQFSQVKTQWQFVFANASP